MAEHYLVSIEPYHSRSEPAAALDSLIKSGTLRELRLDSVTFRQDVLREGVVGSLLSESPDLITKLPLEKRALLDLERGMELAARLAIENAPDAAAWLTILGPGSQRPTHQTWRRAVLLSLVRSEISIRLIRTSAAVLLAEDAFLLRDLIRYVLAVEFESFGRRAKARGLDVPAGASQPIRGKARPRLAEISLCIEIQAKLASTTPCTPEFIEQAMAWADRHVSVLDRTNEFDTSGERSSTTEAVVVAAWLIARDDTNYLIRERGDWMRTVFIKAFAGNDEPNFVMRSGLSMNPRAIAFVGQTLLLHKVRRDGDFRLLLHFVVRSGYPGWYPS